MVIQKEVILDVNPSNLRIDKTSCKTFFGFFALKMNETQKLIACCFGVFICYFYYGILQEKM